MTIGRLAPTPSGGLHLGNARTFLVAWLSARAAGGRVKPGYVEQALEDLRWLGLDWDGEPLYQSCRSDAYAAALEKLRVAGLAYPCVCSRREIELASRAPHAGEDEPVYSRVCRGKFRDASHAQECSGRVPAWRFAVRDEERSVAFDDALHGRCEFGVDDIVIFRNDGVSAYQLATVVDDYFQGVTEVVRGDDLLRSTARQVLLFRALNLPVPKFLHVPLVLDATGERMAKRRDSARLAALREAGVAAARVVGALAASCGWAKPGECAMPKELVGRFNLAVLPREPVRITLGA